MRKLKICKAIAVTLVAGMIITGYKGSITRDTMKWHMLVMEVLIVK